MNFQNIDIFAQKSQVKKENKYEGSFSRSETTLLKWLYNGYFTFRSVESIRIWEFVYGLIRKFVFVDLTMEFFWIRI